MTICVETKDFHCLPWLLYQKASALYWLGHKKEALDVFDEGIIIARNYKEEEMTEFIKERKLDALNGKFWYRFVSDQKDRFLII